MKADLSIGVIGSGTMGAGIAQVIAQSNISVYLYDVSKEILEGNIKRIHQRFDRLVEKERITKEQSDQAKLKLTAALQLEDLKDCQIVIEAVPENIEIKKSIFRQLDEVCKENTILATNTSSFSVTEIGSFTDRPDRVCGMHFFNPVPLMPLVEVIKGERTGQQSVDKVVELAKELGKIPVTCKDTPGFIVNRVARPFYNEALKIANEQTATVEQIDRIMKKAGGFRMGPFELQDLIGIDINFATTKSVHAGFFGESRFRPSYDQERKVMAGRLGRKAGGGFYSYDN